MKQLKFEDQELYNILNQLEPMGVEIMGKPEKKLDHIGLLFNLNFFLHNNDNLPQNNGVLENNDVLFGNNSDEDTSEDGSDLINNNENNPEDNNYFSLSKCMIM